MSTATHAPTPADVAHRASLARADIPFGQRPSVSSEAVPCDRCPSASAKVKALYASGPVFLCGHHARLAWDQLERTALNIRSDVPGETFYLPVSPR